MSELYYDVRVDIRADNVLDSGYHFVQGDSNQILLRILVMNGSTLYDASDASQVTINFRKADGTSVEGEPSKSGNAYIYRFIGNELEYPGKVIGDLKFEYSSGRVSTCRFSFYVEEDTIDGSTTKSSSYLSTMEEYRKQAADMVGSISASKDSIAGYAETATEAATSATASSSTAKSYADASKEYSETAASYVTDYTYTHVKYATQADGSDMVDEPVEDVTIYMGIYTGTSKTAPGDYRLYKWNKVRGDDGNAYWATFDIVDCELIMTFNTDTSTISFAINENSGELEVTT